jgi:hypothetical protein
MPTKHTFDANTLNTGSARPRRAIAAIARVALLAAGCGSSSRSPSSSSHPSFQSFTGSAYKFASCMRSHGVSDFPDPRIVNQPYAVTACPTSPIQPARAS